MEKKKKVKQLLKHLESENVEARLWALDEIIKKVDELDRIKIIKALKPHILDWDDEVRKKVALALKIYTGKQ